MTNHERAEEIIGINRTGCTCAQCQKENGLIDRVAAALDTARKDALQEAAKVVEEKAALYPIGVFSEPTAGSLPDCYAAGMARHCSVAWAEEIRALAEMGGKE